MEKFTISRIKEEMTKVGISFTGIYENLPQMILDALDTVETFGFDHWANNSTAGPKIKILVRQLNTLRLMYLFNDQIESIAVYAKAINFDSENGDFGALLRGWLEQGRKFAIACEINKTEVLTLMKKLTK